MCYDECFPRLTSNSHTKRILCSKHRSKAGFRLLSEGYHGFSVFSDKVVDVTPGGVVHGFVVWHREHIKISNEYCVKKLGALCD